MTSSNSVVIDTHALVWYLEEDPRLSTDASQTFDRIDQSIITGVVPTIVLAEIMHISERGRITSRYQDVARQLEESPNFVIAPFDFDILAHMQDLTGLELHDRIIVGTSLSIGARLITRDETVRNANVVDCIW